MEADLNSHHEPDVSSTFAIESPVFHTCHAISSIFEASERYIALFDRAVLYVGYSERHSRRAAFVLVSEVWIELVEATPPATTFLERFGEHQQGLAFKVRGIDALAQSLVDHDIRFGDSYGRQLTVPVPRNGPILHPRGGPTTPLQGGVESHPDWWSATLYTHMADAHGWYEFCEPKAHHNRIDPRQAPGWRPGRLVGDPLGIVAGSHHTVVVRSVDDAVQLWTSALGAEVVTAIENRALATRSVFVRLGEGEGTVLEFAEPIGEGPAARDYEMARRGILHCVNFVVDDLDDVRRHLHAIDCAIEVDTDELVVTDPAFCSGARYGFTSKPASEW